MGPVTSTQKEYRSLKKIFAVCLYRSQVIEIVSVVDLRGELSGKDRLCHEHSDFFRGEESNSIKLYALVKFGVRIFQRLFLYSRGRVEVKLLRFIKVIPQAPNVWYIGWT